MAAVRIELLSDARGAALRALLQVDSGLIAQHALEIALSESGLPLSDADKGLATELFYGVLRSRLRLDCLLGKFLKKPQKLPAALRYILRIGAYSLLFQQRVPQYAAVNEAVEQARRLFPPPLARLANATLRGIQRFGESVHEPQFYVEDKLSTRLAEWQGQCCFYSIPERIANIWDNAYGREVALTLMRRSFDRPWPCLRLNAQKSDSRRIATALAEYGAVCPASFGFAFPPGFLSRHILSKPLSDWQREGYLTFQSAGSQAVAEALGLAELTYPWWDACAGQGGKTFWLLERGERVVLCSDVSMPRLARVRGECLRLGLPLPLLHLADAARPALRQWEGNILLDVPCSGLGVLARRPDLRNQANLDRLDAYPALQAQLLRQTADRLLPGRCLAYITCTLNPKENQEQIANFLLCHADYTLLKQWQTPFDHPWMEGMYGALLQRR